MLDSASRVWYYRQGKILYRVVLVEHFVRMNQLYDFYGQLLTAKQQRAMEWYFAHDLSLAEIANELNISRQAVHDLLQRSESVLEMYESKLRLAQRYAQQQACLSQLRCLLMSYRMRQTCVGNKYLNCSER